MISESSSTEHKAKKQKITQSEALNSIDQKIDLLENCGVKFNNFYFHKLNTQPFLNQLYNKTPDKEVDVKQTERDVFLKRMKSRALLSDYVNELKTMSTYNPQLVDALKDFNYFVFGVKELSASDIALNAFSGKSTPEGTITTDDGISRLAKDVGELYASSLLNSIVAGCSYYAVIYGELFKPLIYFYLSTVFLSVIWQPLSLNDLHKFAKSDKRDWDAFETIFTKSLPETHKTLISLVSKIRRLIGSDLYKNFKQNGRFSFVDTLHMIEQDIFGLMFMDYLPLIRLTQRSDLVPFAMRYNFPVFVLPVDTTILSAMDDKALVKRIDTDVYNAEISTMSFSRQLESIVYGGAVSLLTDPRMIPILASFYLEVSRADLKVLVNKNMFFDRKYGLDGTENPTKGGFLIKKLGRPSVSYTHTIAKNMKYTERMSSLMKEEAGSLIGSDGESTIMTKINDILGAIDRKAVRAWESLQSGRISLKRERMAANVYGVLRSEAGSSEYPKKFIKKLYGLVKEGNIPALIDIDFVRGVCKEKIISDVALWKHHKGVRIPVNSLPLHCLPFAIMDSLFGFKELGLNLLDSIEVYLAKVDEKMAAIWTQDTVLTTTDECRQILIDQIRTTCTYDICFDMHIHGNDISLVYHHKNTLSSMCKIPSMHTKLGVSDSLEGARSLYDNLGRSSVLAMYHGLSVIHRMVLEKKTQEDLENMKAEWSEIFSTRQRLIKAPRKSTFNGFELLKLTEYEGVFVFWLVSFIKGKLQHIDRPLSMKELYELDAMITKRCHEKFGRNRVDSHMLGRVRDVLECFVNDKSGLLGLVYSNFGKDKNFIVLNPRPESLVADKVETGSGPIKLKSELDINTYTFKRSRGSLFIQDDLNTCN